MDVCARVTRSRRKTSDDADHFHTQQRRLAKAYQMLGDIGHLASDETQVDLTTEARALCSWLESRERAQGVKRPSRRGQEYQDRLRQVLGFLQAETGPEAEDEKPVLPFEPPQQVAVPNYGVTDG
jgi:hypothetical protein